MSNHTPTPWKVRNAVIGSTEIIIIDANWQSVGFLTSKKKEAAALIVKAVNCYDELVAFIKKIQDELPDLIDRAQMDHREDYWLGELDDLIKEIDIVLAKAGAA